LILSKTLPSDLKRRRWDQALPACADLLFRRDCSVSALIGRITVSCERRLWGKPGRCSLPDQGPLSADFVEKLPFGDVRFSGRPMGAAFKKSAGGPANLSIAQRARSSTGLRWCWAAMFHRIAIWRVFVTLDFSTFSTSG